jgi:hypothetical protein
MDSPFTRLRAGGTILLWIPPRSQDQKDGIANVSRFGVPAVRPLGQGEWPSSGGCAGTTRLLRESIRVQSSRFSFPKVPAVSGVGTAPPTGCRHQAVTYGQVGGPGCCVRPQRRAYRYVVYVSALRPRTARSAPRTYRRLYRSTRTPSRASVRLLFHPGSRTWNDGR